MTQIGCKTGLKHDDDLGLKSDVTAEVGLHRMPGGTAVLVRKHLNPGFIEDGAILLDDALSNTPYGQAYRDRTESSTYFKSGGSTGGWGSGAAVGAKLACPDQDVVLASGGGYFMFGTPLAGLWAAGYHQAPFLSVVGDVSKLWICYPHS